MKVKVTIEIELELSKEVSIADCGLNDRINGDIIEGLSEMDLDFQDDEDEDVEVISVTGSWLSTENIG